MDKNKRLLKSSIILKANGYYCCLETENNYV